MLIFMSELFIKFIEFEYMSIVHIVGLMIMTVSLSISVFNFSLEFLERSNYRKREKTLAICRHAFRPREIIGLNISNMYPRMYYISIYLQYYKKKRVISENHHFPHLTY